MQYQIGDRVVAIRTQRSNVVTIYGYGVYEGDFIPESAAGQMGEMLRLAGQTNPRIKLDNGNVVWGCECWWSDEASFKKAATKLAITEVDIIEDRKKIVNRIHREREKHRAHGLFDPED